MRAVLACSSGVIFMEIGVYLPQVSITWEDLRATVQACDALGIDSVWFMDHLYPPTLPHVPSFEAWTTAAALAPVTERIRFGHLVLCNGFRHPALLAKMAITLDHASGGRLALGLGSGSYAPEFAEFGMPFPSARERAVRLDEALTVIRSLFTDASSSFEGSYYALRAAPSLPRPLQQPHPPIHVGGAGERRTLPLVARHADVWNCPTYALAERRFPGPGWGFAAGGYCGTPDDVVARIRARQQLGVDGFIFFLHDRAQPETLRLLATEVLPHL